MVVAVSALLLAFRRPRGRTRRSRVLLWDAFARRMRSRPRLRLRTAQAHDRGRHQTPPGNPAPIAGFLWTTSVIIHPGRAVIPCPPSAHLERHTLSGWALKLTPWFRFRFKHHK